MSGDFSGQLTLLQLNRRVGDALASASGLNGVWIVAETSDLRCSGGHCYMELVQKDEAGTPLAKARAVIWASAYARLGAFFAASAGTRLASDMKVMVRVNVTFHAVYGMSLVITDINPEYTVGDLVRRRNRIISRLREEGVYDLNRTLPWTAAVQRVAVVSARGAAGYGDFIRHLYLNPLHLRFSTTLFEAVMQGERAPASIVSALETIAAREEDFDCVVIIRGGGAVSDLACFDDYELASNIAQFPLPVIVGIGHERDVTVLDYVASVRVKTPTAAAEFLIGRLTAAYEHLADVGRSVRTVIDDIIGGQYRQLEYYRGQIPALVRTVIVRAKAVERYAGMVYDLAVSVVERHRSRLYAIGELLEALAPEATLRRGYSITRVAGKAVTDSTRLNPDDVLETTFAAGPVIVTKQIK